MSTVQIKAIQFISHNHLFLHLPNIQANKLSSHVSTIQIPIFILEYKILAFNSEKFNEIYSTPNKEDIYNIKININNFCCLVKENIPT